MFLSTIFKDLKYLYTNISARRSVECEVISDIFSCCERFKAPLNCLNFHSQDAFLEGRLPALAIRRFNSFFDLLQSKSIFLFICSTEKQKKENLRLTPPHSTFMLVKEPGIFVNLPEFDLRYFIRDILINSYAFYPSTVLSSLSPFLTFINLGYIGVTETTLHFYLNLAPFHLLFVNLPQNSADLFFQIVRVSKIICFLLRNKMIAMSFVITVGYCLFYRLFHFV